MVFICLVVYPAIKEQRTKREPKACYYTMRCKKRSLLGRLLEEDQEEASFLSCAELWRKAKESQLSVVEGEGWGGSVVVWHVTCATWDLFHTTYYAELLLYAAFWPSLFMVSKSKKVIRTTFDTKLWESVEPLRKEKSCLIKAWLKN